MEHNMQRHGMGDTYQISHQNGFEQYKEQIRHAKMRVLTHVRSDERTARLHNRR